MFNKENYSTIHRLVETPVQGVSQSSVGGVARRHPAGVRVFVQLQTQGAPPTEHVCKGLMLRLQRLRLKAKDDMKYRWNIYV